MKEYLYLYRFEEAPRSPEQMQQQMQKWMAWMKALGEKGHLKDPGQPLEAAGKVVRGAASKRSVTDGPYTETKDIVGGYTLVLAKDLDEAVELSAGCPILEGSGSVEVRPVRKIDI